MILFFNSLSFWDWLDLVGIIFVFVGVVGEIVVPRLNFRPPPKRTSDEMDEDAPIITRWQADKDAWQSKMKKWEHASEIVLVIGLALELTALPHHFKEAGRLAKDAADAKELAGEANERAEEFNARAARTESNNIALRTNVLSLQKELAEMTQRATSNEVSMLELEYLTKPRRILNISESVILLRKYEGV